MRTILSALGVLLLATTAMVAEGEGTYYGEAFDIADVPAPAVSTVMADTTMYGREVILTGTILDVCQKKGCWLVVSDGTSQMRVTFRDYAFFVPTDAFNRTVLIRGVVSREVLDEETAKHYAEESKGEDPDAIEGPQEVITMVATGVLIRE